MKKIPVIVFGCLLAASLGAETVSGKVLYVYDEVNEQSKPYISYFRDGFAAAGISFDEAAASGLKAKDLSSYEFIVVHGMVMAFNSKSPVRDWLKTKPDLDGKKVSLFVTANRWFLKNLFGQLTELLRKENADVIDAVSMATKDTDAASEAAAVKAQISRLK